MALTCASFSAAAAEPVHLEVDFSKPSASLRALHGWNKGPLTAGEMIDLGVAQRKLAPPHIRLHDCHWPNPDVVDMHVVFPNSNSDPELADSYDFQLTDRYVSAALATGAQLIYRLGESIEHGAIKRFVHPPADPARWARACLGVIRHYNEGWVKGFHHGIRYWEIWNEPENRPVMWSGTDADYFRLYAVTARTIKAEFPELKVGGPAVGNTGTLVEGKLLPSEFLVSFLETCQREKLPLDFFSWHCYTDDSAELVARARGIRALLDAHGFTGTESHLNEWNYLPGNTWEPALVTAAPEARQHFYERMRGSDGAAFIALVLSELQDAPVDVCNLFHGELGGFGLFTEHGVPGMNYRAIELFKRLLDCPDRVRVSGSQPGKLATLAGLGATRKTASILVSTSGFPEGDLEIRCLNVPWNGSTSIEIERADGRTVERQEFSEQPPIVNIPGAGPDVVLLRLTPSVQ